MSIKEKTYRRGDIYLADLNPSKGSEQGGIRPVVNLQNNAGNFFCPTLIVAPVTSVVKKRTQPTHYLLKNAEGLTAPSIVELEQITTIDKRRVIRLLGRVTDEQMLGIDSCLKDSLGIVVPECEEAP